jgi:hypothetical protein
VELGVFPCEQSARQVWHLHPTTRTLTLSHPSNVDWMEDSSSSSSAMELCAAHGDSNRNFFRLADCNDNKKRLLKLQFQKDSKQAVDLDSGLCLSLAGEVRESGALLELTPCIPQQLNDRPFAHQQFMLDDITGEIRSLSNDNLCVTAGWNYLNSVAFEEDGKSIVVLMNEAPVGTAVTLQDDRRAAAVAVQVPARSILTFMY